jgi:beta-glucosidase-like glycosyl hydrolase
VTELARGPAFVGIEGASLTAADRERVRHPLVGGVILFTRNFESCAQLRALTEAIRGLRDPAPLIGRRPRRRPRAALSRRFHRDSRHAHARAMWDRDVAAATKEAIRLGRTLGAELAAHGVDFSFTPVLDIAPWSERRHRRSRISFESQRRRASRFGAPSWAARGRDGRRRQAFSRTRIRRRRFP